VSRWVSDLRLAPRNLAHRRGFTPAGGPFSSVRIAPENWQREQ